MLAFISYIHKSLTLFSGLISHSVFFLLVFSPYLSANEKLSPKPLSDVDIRKSEIDIRKSEVDISKSKIDISKSKIDISKSKMDMRGARLYTAACDLELRRHSADAPPSWIYNANVHYIQAPFQASIQNSTPAKVDFLLRSNCASASMPAHFIFQIATEAFADKTGTTGYSHPSVLSEIKHFQLAMPSMPVDVSSVSAFAPGGGATKFSLNLLDDLNKKPDQLQQFVFENFEKSWAEHPEQAGQKNKFPKPLDSFRKTLYLRLVPVKDDGVLNGKPSNWVQVHVYPSDYAKKEYDQMALTMQAYDERSVDDAQWKTLSELAESTYRVEMLSYIPPKFSDDDAASNYFRMGGNLMLHFDGNQYKKPQDLFWEKGQTYSLAEAKYIIDSNITPNQELWLVSAATLDMTSNAFKQAKQATVDTVAKGINEAGIISCNNACKKALMAGLDFALVYAGIPPNLPTSDKLLSAGASYVASTMVEVAFDQIPADLLESKINAAAASFGSAGQNLTKEQLYQKAKEKVKSEITAKSQDIAADAVKTMMNKFRETNPDLNNPSTWGTPEPAFRAHPPVAYFRISRLSTGEVKGVADESNQTLSQLRVNVGANNYLQSEMQLINLPKIKPGGSIVVPVIFTPISAPWPYLYSPACGGFNNIPCTLEAFNGTFSAGYGQNIYNTSGSVPLSITTVHQYSLMNKPELAKTTYIQRLSTNIAPGYVNPVGPDGKHPTKNFYGEIKVTSVSTPSIRK